MLGGSLDVLLGDEIVVLGEGDFLLVPPLLTHAFAPTAGCAAETLFVLTPGVPRDDDYRLLDRVHAREADPAEIPASQERFDNHYVRSETWERALTAR